MRESYNAKGNVFCRNVFRQDEVAEIRRAGSEIYRYIVGSERPSQGANTLHFSDIVKQPVPWMRDFIVWLVAVFSKTEVYEFYERLYGSSVAIPLLNCVFRYQGPHYVGSYLPYHQDATAGKLANHVINCWTALDHCGVDAPSIEALNKRFDELRPEFFIYETLEQVNEARWQEKYDALMAAFGNSGVTRPVFEPGDALVFDHLVFHRTYVEKRMTKPRMSIELRGCHPRGLWDAWGEVDRVTATRKGKAFEYFLSMSASGKAVSIPNSAKSGGN